MRRLFPDNPFVAPQYPNVNKDLVRLVVAEAPGSEEAVAGVPLVGGSGRIFDKLLSKIGIDRAGLTVANCIQCQPPGNVFPTDHAARKYISKEEGALAVAHCWNKHLEPLLNSRDWKRIDLLGDKPLRLVARRRDGIFNSRGSSLVIDRSEGHSPVKGLATLHPSYLMRDQIYLPVAANDLKKSLDVDPEDYLPFPSLEDVRNFTATTFAFDIECPKYKWLGDKAPPEMVGLCADKGKAMCVPIKGPYIPELRRIFINAKEIIGHNALQFDIPRLFKALDIRDETM